MTEQTFVCIGCKKELPHSADWWIGVGLAKPENGLCIDCKNKLNEAVAAGMFK